MDVREKHQLVASHSCTDLGLNPQPRHVPGMGIKPATLHFAGQCPTNWATKVRVACFHFWCTLWASYFCKVPPALGIYQSLQGRYLMYPETKTFFLFLKHCIFSITVYPPYIIFCLHAGPSPCNHHTVVCVQESVFFFAWSLQPPTPPRAVSLSVDLHLP